MDTKLDYDLIEQKLLQAAWEKELLENIREYTAVSNEDRMRELHVTAQEASKREPYTNKDLYIVLVKTNSRDEFRKPIDRWFVRLSCPTPGYNQDVWKYHHVSGAMEYLWSIPRKYRYYQIILNKNKYLENKEMKRLATFVHAMETGELLRWVKKENGEKPDAIIRVNNAIA